MNLKTPLNRFRILALLEGISYLLLGITMPLKYMLDIKEPNYIVGMVHGVLFMAYVVIAFQCIYRYKWGFLTAIWVFTASLIPFGTFILDVKVLRPLLSKVELNKL